MDKVFLATLLRSDEFVNWAVNHSAGTKMPRVSLDAFRKFECILPPLAQQREFVAIAERSEKLRADLEKGITAIEAVIRSLIVKGTAVLG